MVTPEALTDFLFYLAFLGGQLLFILKRAASAIRSKTNPISSRTAFIAANWDVLLIRCLLELPIYWAYRHYDQANKLLAMFTTWRIPMWLPQAAIVAFFIGFISDFLLDWVGTSAKAPNWLKENIPDVQVFSSRTVSSKTDSSGAAITVEKTVTVEKTPPQEKP